MAGTPPGNPAQELAKGLWRVTGTTHHSLIVEFNDHLMVVEANNPERVAAVWARAKELRPNKPITQLIVTHHHFDHTGGVREAVARGVTEIIAHQHNVNFLTQMLKRPHTINPDALAKMGTFKMPKITAIGDSGVVKDSSMTVNLYHLRDNTHADSNLLIYFPASKVLTQVDVYMPNDARHIIRRRAAWPRAVEPERDGEHQAPEDSGGHPRAASRRRRALEQVRRGYDCDDAVPAGRSARGRWPRRRPWQLVSEPRVDQKSTVTPNFATRASSTSCGASHVVVTGL